MVMSDKVRLAKFDLGQRTIAYSLRIIKLYREVRKDCVGAILGRQLLRSGTSIGANVHEAQGGQSKADFVSKISMAYKEARESAYWLRLIERAEIIRCARHSSLSDETDQLIKILSSILLTAKQRKESKSRSRG